MLREKHPNFLRIVVLGMNGKSIPSQAVARGGKPKDQPRAIPSRERAGEWGETLAVSSARWARAVDWDGESSTKFLRLRNCREL